MKRYESYKDSGVKWLGEIPGHWEVLPLKYIFKLQKKLVGRNSNKYKLLSLTLQGIKVRDLENPTGKFPSSFDSYQIVEPGDFIFCNFDNEETPRAVGQSKFKGMITGAYDVFGVNNNNMDSNYLLYYCLYIDDAKRFKPLYKGLRKTIPFDSFMSYKIAIPPKAEQTAIANYLDSVTSKIDEAISQQQKMIDLLNERKQIIIQNAVTKGLDPNAKMKDSGVEWIGEIPENWEVYKFGRLISLLTDYTANGSFGDLAKNIHYQNEGYARLVRLTDLRENLNNIGVWVDKHGYDFLSKSWLKGGELLIANVGAYSGLPCIMPKVPYPTTLAPNMFLLKLNESKIYTKYIYYLLLSNCYFNWLQTIATSSAQPKLNKDNIRQLIIIHPINIKDQYDIVLYIKKKLHPIDESISQCNKMISLLQERKQIIINDVVTGKVKVI